MKLCTNCGHQNRSGTNFCTQCGNGLAIEPYIVGRLVVMGADGEKQEYLISVVERFIGRGESNDIVLSDDEVSTAHAKISYQSDSFWVEDLDTTNGTHVNGERIQAPTLLKNDDLIKMGHTILKFRV